MTTKNITWHAGITLRDVIKHYFGKKMFATYEQTHGEIGYWSNGLSESYSKTMELKKMRKMDFAEICKTVSTFADEYRNKRYSSDLIALRKKAKQEKEEAAILNCRGFESAKHVLNMGADYSVRAYFARKNDICCVKTTEWVRYTSRKSFLHNKYEWTLEIKRGWRVAAIGGLLTFYKGDKINRTGMAVEWVEQGRAFDDITIKRGYLVRGEHIEAKSLDAAKKINAEHRANILLQLLKSRQERKRVRAEVKAGTHKITLKDSIAAGNCRAGSLSFKTKVEQERGEEVNSLTATELKHYAEKYNVTYYADRVLHYLATL